MIVLQFSFTHEKSVFTKIEQRESKTKIIQFFPQLVYKNNNDFFKR